MENEILEKLFNKIVDVLFETFTRKYHFVKMLHSKKCHMYLFVRKKKGRLIGEEKSTLHKKYLTFPQVFLNGTVINMTSWAKKTS